jgi:hypothetical protein
MIYLNCIVGMKGTASRTALKIRLSNDILDQLSRLHQVILNNIDFVLYLQSIGTDHEAYIAEKILIDSTIDNQL